MVAPQSFPTAVTDQRRVECTNAATGKLTVTCCRGGVQGTVLVGQTFRPRTSGSFVGNGGWPGWEGVSLDTNGDGGFLELTPSTSGPGATASI